MNVTDADLRDDLQAAYGRDLPGDEFDERVCGALEEGSGGESEVGIELRPVTRLRWYEALLAAGIVGVLFLLANVSGPSGRGVTPAGGLPVARTGVEATADLAFEIDGEGGTKLGDQTIATAELHDAVVKAVMSHRDSDGDDPTVTIAAASSAPWSAVHGVLAGLRKVKVASALLAVRDEASGETRYLAVPSPSDPALEGRPSRDAKPEPVFIELQRSVEEATTRVMFRGDEIGRDANGLRDLRAVVAFFHPREPKGLFRGGVRLRAWAGVPHGQVVRAIDDLRTDGVPKILIDVNAPAFLTVFVRLQTEKDRTILFLGEERTRYKMKEGLAALAESIRKHKADGRKPHGFLSARVYIDQAAVERVMEVFEAEGVKDVVRLS